MARGFLFLQARRAPHRVRQTRSRQSAVRETYMTNERLKILLGCLLATAVALALFHRADPDAAIAESMGEATTKHGTLLGYTKYKDYLAASKSVLGERTKFVETTVVRRYTVNRGV